METVEFWQPLSAQISFAAPSFCIRPEWSSPGESIWMRLAKFSWCNHLPLRTLAQYFALSLGDALVNGVDLRRADRVRLPILACALGESIESIQTGFCVEAQHHVLGLASTELRHCAQCFGLGFHSALFQWRFFVRCPVHRTALRSGCPLCYEPIAYRLDTQLASSPLRCPVCKAAWVPALERPAGRSQPVSEEHAELLQGWQHYVAQAIGPSGSRVPKARGPDGHFNRVTPQTRQARRWRFIAILNQLYSTPPPQTDHLPATATVVHLGSCAFASQSHPLIVRRAPRPPWPTVLWRSFNRRFIALESILHQQRAGLVFHGAPDLSRIEAVFHAEPIAFAEAADLDAIAALGWRMSWYGHLNPRSALRAPTCPAFGLAVWLAELPELAPNTRRPPTFSELAQWLLEDLHASWHSWRQLASFMRSNGRYFLHPALVRPAKFAEQRRVSSTEISSIPSSTPLSPAF